MSRQFYSFFSNGKSLNLVSVAVVAMLAFSVIFVSSASANSGEPATFSLTTASNGHGNVSPSGDITVLEGSRLSFIFNPETNYRIADIIVDGNSVGPIHALSFENIDASHTVQAIFEIDLDVANVSADESGRIGTEGKAVAELR